MGRFLLFLIRVQWIDRRATSSFVIGITLQTALLTLAVYERAANPAQGLVMATRAAVLTCTAIILLAAMSSVRNEFRDGTAERVLLGAVPFTRLLVIRAAASAVVCSPAVVVPFAGAAARFPHLVSWHTAVLVAMVYLFLAALCHQASLLLCQFRDAAAPVPWLRMALLFAGLSVIPFPGSAAVALALPTGWILRFAQDPSWAAAAGFAAVTAAWSAGIRLALGGRALRMIERNLSDGAERT
jgi:ABC-type transport system involved in multi-copper enzyme maturation permease subunit